MDLTQYSHIHFIGIGGVGMRALANVLLAKGIHISGSDQEDDDVFGDFRKKGADIYIGHQEKNVIGADLVVVSTAIPANNPELKYAQENQIPIVHRSDILASLMNGNKGIAVAGAHGKTTTTSMIGAVLEKGATDSTIIIGGEVSYLKGNSRYGKGPYVLAEADESDGSFLKLYPCIAVITNIEDDHLDHYGSIEAIENAFVRFADQVDKTGTIVACADNSTISKLCSQWKRKVVTYGLSNDADYTAKDIRYENGELHFDVYFEGKYRASTFLRIPGRYNVLNALATIAVGRLLGLSFETIADGLASFTGTKRRFQTIGKVSDIWVVDDYAHHPTEIRATLTAAKAVCKGRVICAFQPHRYSRTKLLKDEFACAFDQADMVLFTDIYSAGEEPLSGVDGSLLPDLVSERKPSVQYIPNRKNIATALKQVVKPGDVVITMGAGDIYESAMELLALLREE